MINVILLLMIAKLITISMNVKFVTNIIMLIKLDHALIALKIGLYFFILKN